MYFPRNSFFWLIWRSGKSIGKSMERNPKIGLKKYFPRIHFFKWPPLTLMPFLKLLQWTRVKKNITSLVRTYIWGLRMLFLVILWFKRHSLRPLLFLHPLTGGCGTRLSIRRQDPNNYSDTETRCLVYFFFVFNKVLHHNGHNKNNIWTPVLVYSVGWLVRLIVLVGCFGWLVVTFGWLIWSVDWNIWKPKPWEYISYELLTPLSVTVAAGRVWKYSKSRFQQKIKHANNFLAFGKHFELWRTPHFTDKKKWVKNL